MSSGTAATATLARNNFLKSNFRRNKPVCMLEIDVRINWILATQITVEYSLPPRSVAMRTRFRIISRYKVTDKARFDQKATFAS